MARREVIRTEGAWKVGNFQWKRMRRMLRGQLLCLALILWIAYCSGIKCREAEDYKGPYGDSKKCYKIVKKPTFKACSESCVQSGGYVTALPTQSDWDVLQTYLREQTPQDLGDNHLYWIGLQCYKVEQLSAGKTCTEWNILTTPKETPYNSSRTKYYPEPEHYALQPGSNPNPSKLIYNSWKVPIAKNQPWPYLYRHRYFWQKQKGDSYYGAVGKNPDGGFRMDIAFEEADTELHKYNYGNVYGCICESLPLYPTSQPTSVPTSSPTTVLERSCKVKGDCGDGMVCSSETETCACESGLGYYSSKRECNFCSGGWVEENETNCQNCDAGKYKPDRNTKAISKSVCKDCPKGLYNSEAGQECQESPPGYFTPEEGAKEPIPCPVGRYAEGFGRFDCSLCPISSYSDSKGADLCTVCPPGTVTPNRGCTAKTDCVDPESNFIIAIFTLIAVIIVSYEYMLRGRFQLVGFLRKARVHRPLTSEALGIATYLYRYIYKAEAQRVYLTGKRTLRVTIFLIIGILGVVLVTIAGTLLAFAKVIVKAMIVVVGLKVDLPFIESVQSMGTELLSTLNFEWLTPLLEVFIYVIGYLVQFRVDLSFIHLTCTGAMAPLKLFSNICVIGVIIIVVEAEFPFLDSVTIKSLSEKFYRIVVSISYITWSPTNFSRLREKYFLHGGEDRPHREGVTGALYAVGDYFRSFFPPTASLFSFHYLGVLFTSLITSVVQAADVFQMVLQYVASRIVLVDFVERDSVMHAWDDNCNYIPGFPYFDSGVAITSSILAWILLLPALYMISEILIPGIPTGVEQIETDIHHKQSTTWNKMYLNYYKALSVLAPDLWWAESTRSWGRYIVNHTPYDTGKTSPSLSQVQKIAKFEDKAVKSRFELDHEEAERQGEKRQALLTRVLRSRETIETMALMEAPERFTYRIKVERYMSEASLASIGGGRTGRDREEAASSSAEPAHLCLRLFRCYRIIDETKVWTEIKVDPFAEDNTDPYFTLVKIEARTGDIDFLRSYGSWSLQDSSSTELLVKDLRDCRPDQLVLLVKWGKHTGASDRMIEESLLKATRADDYLSEEVINVMHANTPSSLMKVKERSLHTSHLGNVTSKRAVEIDVIPPSPSSSTASRRESRESQDGSFFAGSFSGSFHFGGGGSISSPVRGSTSTSTSTSTSASASGADNKSKRTSGAPPGGPPPPPPPPGRASVRPSVRPSVGASETTTPTRRGRHGRVNLGSEASSIDAVPSPVDIGRNSAISTPQRAPSDASQAGKRGSSVRDSATPQTFEKVQYKVSTEERQEFLTVMKNQALSNTSSTLVDLADAVAWMHGDSSTLPDTQAHFLIGTRVDPADKEREEDTDDVITGGYMRWVSNSGMVYSKAHSLIEDITWKYPHLVSEGVLLDAEFTAGVRVVVHDSDSDSSSSDSDDEEGEGEGGDEKQEPARSPPRYTSNRRGSTSSLVDNKDDKDDKRQVRAAWELYEEDSFGYKDFACIPSTSYVLAPTRMRTDEENEKYHKRLKFHLPAYLRLCELEYEEMSLWPSRLLGPGGLLHCCGCDPTRTLSPRFTAIIRACVMFFCVLGLGHPFTVVGRRAWYLVLWKFYRFLLLCLGYWTEDVVELYHLHDKIASHSVVWMHPSFRTSRVHVYGADNPNFKSASAKESRRNRLSQRLSASMGRPSVSAGGGKGAVAGGAAGTSTWSLLRQGKYREWWKATFHHDEETHAFKKLGETTLKVLYANDYAAALRSIVATRSVFLQLVPGFALLSIFAELTANAPLFVYSEQLELSLPELIAKDPVGMAREVEREFTITANEIRKTELTENDNVVPEQELQHLTPYEIKVMRKANEASRAKMKQCIAQGPLQVKEWVVRLESVRMMLEQSRIVTWFLEALQFVMVLWILFGTTSSHKMFVMVGLCVLVPLSLVRALAVLIGIGKALAITDADLNFFYSRVQTTVSGTVSRGSTVSGQKAKVEEGGDVKDEDDDDEDSVEDLVLDGVSGNQDDDDDDDDDDDEGGGQNDESIGDFHDIYQRRNSEFGLQNPLHSQNVNI